MKLSEHFDSSEFQERGSTVTVAVDPRLVAGLERMRNILLSQIRITSGWRDPVHNKAVGGVHNSQHMAVPVSAVDIEVPGTSLLDVYEAALQVPDFRNGGIGLYPSDGHLHVDVRVSGRARWIG